ncbi:molybdopterin-binding protein [Streptomyces globisporus]
MEDVTDGKAWLAHSSDGFALSPDHGGPARLHDYGDHWREQRYWSD